MNKLFAKSSVLALSIQLTLGTGSVLASGEQTLMNTTLPLPDVAVKVTNKPSRMDDAKSAALRFFGRKPAEQPITPMKVAPPTVPATETAAAPTAAPTTEAKLETTPSWSEEGSVKPAATAAAPAATPTPTALPQLRDAIEVSASQTAANQAEAEKAAAEVTAATATSAATAATEAATAPPAVTSEAATTAEGATANFKLTEPIKQDSQMALLPTTPAKANDVFAKGLIVIDNDEQVEQQATIAYEELALDEETKSKAKVGARFPIMITSEITSRTAKVGDPVQGRLKYDLKIGDRLIASKGCVVRGHLNYALKARTALHALWSPERWYKNSGCLGIQFDEIISHNNEHIPLVAEPAKSALYVKNKAEGRVLGINHQGQIAGPWSQQLKYKAVRVGMNFAMAPLGTMSFGAMPVALGVIGAVNPSFAFMKPVGLNVRHRRLKGFAWGFLSGVPGSWLIEDTTVKGQEAVIKPGDEFLAELRQEFTGEPATDAEMLGGADGKVHGEVVGSKGNKVERRKKKAAKPQPAA